MTATETRTIRQTQTSNPDPHTGLPILIGKSVFDRAIRRFPNHFASAVADFRRNNKGPIQRQVWKEFRDAVPNTEAGHDRQFVASLERKFVQPDGTVPTFLFRQNKDILFVCIENRQTDQLMVIYPAKADPFTGRPVLEASSGPSHFANTSHR